jgi:predicted DNA-binding transcriptional regulator AlpA
MKIFPTGKTMGHETEQTPLLFRTEQMAAMLNIGRSRLDELVRQNRLPAPKKVNGTNLWDGEETCLAYLKYKGWDGEGHVPDHHEQLIIDTTKNLKGFCDRVAPKLPARQRVAILEILKEEIEQALFDLGIGD